MSVITFWNNENGNIGQTASILAVATVMAIEHNYKVLIISTKKDDLEGEKAFGISESVATKVFGIRDTRFDSGIQGIMKLAYSNKLNPEMIGDYTKIVLKNRLEIIAGKKQENNTNDDDKFDVNLYPDIIKNANRHYDLVFVDLDSKLDEEYKSKILKLSNIIVWNFEQKFERIEEILKFKQENNIKEDKKIMYLINKYEKNSRYNIKNIVRNSNMKKNIYTVPYDVLFADAMQDGSLDGWLLTPKIRRAEIMDEHGFFASEVKKMCEGILNKLQELHMMG